MKRIQPFPTFGTTLGRHCRNARRTKVPIPDHRFWPAPPGWLAEAAAVDAVAVVAGTVVPAADPVVVVIVPVIALFFGKMPATLAIGRIRTHQKALSPHHRRGSCVPRSFLALARARG